MTETPPDPTTGTTTGTTENPEGRPQAVVRARGLTLPGVATEPVDLDVTAGQLCVVVGPARSGRTSLLLTLAGRMRPAGGDLTVLGTDLPRGTGAVRRRVALGEIRGVNDLDDALTVEQHVAERLVLHSPWWHPWASRRAVAEQLERVDAVVRSGSEGAVDVPPLRPQMFVSDLEPLERMVLGAVLALVGRPEILVVDDVDSLRRSEDRRQAWRALARLAATGLHGRDLTILTAASETAELPSGTPHVSCPLTVIPTGPRHLQDS